MTLAEAVAFIRPAVDPSLRTWADLGAGEGTFAAALATLLAPGSTVYAVEADPAAPGKLTRLQNPSSSTSIVAVSGDVRDLDGIRDLRSVQLEAALLANVLHYFDEPGLILEAVAGRLTASGRVVLIEYDRTSPNPWVPYPIPLNRAPDLAKRVGLRWGGVVAERPSRYQGTLYCAVLNRSRAAG